MAGEWTWQLAAVVGALVGSIMTFIALGGRRRSLCRDQEQSRKTILRELREIEGLLDPARHEVRGRSDRESGRRPEPIRMVQIAGETSKKEAA